jgi:hypothetical protein
MIDKYGISPKYTDGEKNFVLNSSFERFSSPDATPLNWDGGVTDTNTSNSGSYSLKLAASESTIQSSVAAINPTLYGSVVSRVSFKSIDSDVKVEVYDETNYSYFTLTPQPDTENWTLDVTEKEITFDANNSWRDSLCSFSFNPSEHTAVTAIRLKFTNVGAADLFIDDVMLTPDSTGKWPTIYKDGPKSVSKLNVGLSVGSAGHDDPEFHDLWYDTANSVMKYWNGASWTT